MNLSEKQQKYLLNKYKFVAYGETNSVLMIEKESENNYEVIRKDLTDHTSLIPLTDDEVGLLLSLSPDPEINQTGYSEERTEIAERMRRYGC